MANHTSISLNPKTLAYLNNQYPSSFSGNVDSHIDAPFSYCMLFNFSFSSDKEHCNTFNFCVFCRSFSSLIFYFFPVYTINCIFSNWSFISDAITALELLYSFSAMSQKIIPIPPHFTGSDSSFLSISLQKWPSVKFVSTAWSNFSRCSWMLGTVLIVSVTLCLKPPTNAQYAACGSTAAILLLFYLELQVD